MFRIGQKVVCVDDSPSRESGQPIVLRRNAIYTIRAIDDWSEDNGLFLCEIVNNDVPRDDGSERPFYRYRFRPIVEKSTDAGMAILREILDRESFDVKKRERA